MVIIWNGFEQPGATLAEVIAQTEGYCADHAAAPCNCPPHEVRVITETSDITMKIARA